MKYVHTNLICEDWKQQADFYCKVFDCTIVTPFRNQKGKWLDLGLGLSNAKLRGAHLRLPGHGVDGPTLELYTYSKIKKQIKVAPNQRGYGHLAFEVKNVKKTLKKLRRQGGEANGEVVSKKIKGIGELTFVYARDPEGNLIELQNWKKTKKRNE